MTEYVIYQVGYVKPDGTEYQMDVRASSGSQAIRIAENKFRQFGEGKFYIVKED